jgi:hypothetical protein
MLLQGNFRNNHGVGMALMLNTHLSSKGHGAFGDGAGCKGHKGLPRHAIIADLYAKLTVFLP